MKDDITGEEIIIILKEKFREWKLENKAILDEHPRSKYLLTCIKPFNRIVIQTNNADYIKFYDLSTGLTYAFIAKNK